ncbi:MAG: protein kinase domain-containing protein [Gemmatimonadales bacterium]
MDAADRLRTALADRYAIQGEIGRGGMAVVYLARDLRHDRNVAVKVLKPEFASAVSGERFLREIQIEAQLKHPYILPLFDSGDADGVLYYVMPHVEGPSLRARLNQETQLPLDEALRITGEVAEALSYAHSRGLVHCDVKPGNILLDAGHALLADFGIARVLTTLGGKTLTSSGLIVGTPEYMSPEQGSYGGKVDGRSDIYALGCVLYEMLSGEPPFTGPTAQSVIARHMYDQPRSLRVVRSTIPAHIETAIQAALAKVPADRFGSAEQFVAALGPDAEVATAVRPALRRSRQKARRMVGALGGVAIVSGVVIWRFAVPTAEPLDPNKLVLFPLTERMLAGSDSGAGYDVAIMLSAALEHAQPLKWIDGAQRLGPLAAANRGLVPTSVLRDAARAQRAGYYIDGAVLGGAHDSTTVVLRLHDAKGDSVVAQESASAPRDSASAVQLGLRAATRLLPALLDPGRSIDLSALSARKASATALWIQGEHEYRRSRFRNALALYRRAVGEDSAMAFAALKGAQAASWENLGPDALELVAVALARDSLLPSKQRAFARGLQAYLDGGADTAMAWLTKAIAEDPEWAEGHMLLGEVYYHLLPAIPLPLDSLAHSEFSKAARDDRGFAPPLFHLAEIAVRRGELPEAAELIQRFRRFDPDSSRGHQLAIMQNCARDGPAAVAWEHEVSRNPMDVLQAARSLSVAGAQEACAERGFEALLSDSTREDLHWGAFIGLHGIVMSQNRQGEVGPMIDAAVASGLGRASAMYLVDALVGAPVDAKAEVVASGWRRQYGEHYEGISVATRWLLVAWHAHRGDTLRLKGLRAAFLADTQSASLPVREALEGHLALARGDTETAAQTFRTLRVNVPAEALEWGLAEPMAVEHLVMARFALARGNFAEAHRIAGVFDHPAPIAYLPYLPAALEIRRRAAQGMGRPDLVRRYQERLRRLRISGGIASMH